MKSLNKFLGFAAIMAVILFLFSIKDNRNKRFYTGGKADTTTSTTLIVDSVESRPVLSKTAAETVYDTVWKFHKVDTQEILKSHFARHIYKRIYEDSQAHISISDTVFQNQLFAGDLHLKIKRRTIVKHHFITEQIAPSDRWVIGGGLFTVGNNTGAAIGAGYLQGNTLVQTQFLWGKNRGLLISIHKTLSKQKHDKRNI